MKTKKECPSVVFVVWSHALNHGDVFRSLSDAEDAVKDWAAHAPENGPFDVCTYDIRKAG